MGDTGLGAGVKDGIAAANVSPDRVGLADPVANADAVAVARPTASEVILALREKRGEDAVLHVKHGDVLVKRYLEPRRRGDAEKLKNLTDIEIITGGEPLKSFALEKLGGKGVGDVEGKVAGHGEPARTEVVQAAQVADKNPVGF